jgi:hypothetical protein
MSGGPTAKTRVHAGEGQDVLTQTAEKPFNQALSGPGADRELFAKFFKGGFLPQVSL